MNKGKKCKLSASMRTRKSENIPLEEKSISITFHNQKGMESPPMKIGNKQKFAAILDEYAKSNDMPIEEFRFAIYGRRVGGDNTPEELQMVDEDQVDVFQFSHGGIGDILFN